MYHAEDVTTVAPPHPSPPTPATVLSCDPSARVVSLRVAATPERPREARIALPPMESLAPGDVVLVVGSAPDPLYVIGILDKAAHTQTRLLTAPTGARAEADDNGVISIYSTRNELVLEYDSSRDRATIVAPRADMHFEASNGALSFFSSKFIRFTAPSVDLTSRDRIQLSVLGAANRLRSCLTLLSGNGTLQSRDLHVRSSSARLDIGEAQYQGRSLRAALDEARLVLDRVEMLADTVVHRVKSLYRTVRDLAFLRARRSRTIVDESYDLSAKHSRMRAKHTFKVDGEKIYLG